jgi:hypothetical protein
MVWSFKTNHFVADWHFILEFLDQKIEVFELVTLQTTENIDPFKHLQCSGELVVVCRSGGGHTCSRRFFCRDFYSVRLYSRLSLHRGLFFLVALEMVKQIFLSEFMLWFITLIL